MKTIENNVVSLKKSPEKSIDDIFSQYAHRLQARAVDADYEQQSALLDSLKSAYRALRLEKAKFVVALLNPIFFEKSLKSLSGAQEAVVNYWSFGNGLFFFRHYLAVQVGKLSGDIIWRDDLTNGEIMQMAVKLQNTVRWAESELQGENVK